MWSASILLSHCSSPENTTSARLHIPSHTFCIDEAGVCSPRELHHMLDPASLACILDLLVPRCGQFHTYFPFLYMYIHISHLLTVLFS